MTYTINTNTEFNSIEIFFNGIPTEAIRNALKALKFRWHGVKKCWYGYADEATAREAIDNGTAAAPKKKTAQKANKAAVAPDHGVKVGDLFYSSWGYEQTNVNFFQVIALVGKASVRIREVSAELLEEDAVSCMASNRRYRLPNEGELLPPVNRSTFCIDQINGDLRRVNTKCGDAMIKVGDPNHYQETAWKYNGQTVYESWYY